MIQLSILVILAVIIEYPVGLVLLVTRITKMFNNILYVRRENIILTLKACIQSYHNHRSNLRFSYNFYVTSRCPYISCLNNDYNKITTMSLSFGCPKMFMSVKYTVGQMRVSQMSSQSNVCRSSVCRPNICVGQTRGHVSNSIIQFIYLG